MSNPPPTTEAPPDAKLAPYINALREKWSNLPDWELAFAARTVLEVHDEPGKVADFAHIYNAQIRRHRNAALFRVEAIREAVDQIERDLKAGRAPAYQAGAIGTDLIHLGERLAALEAIKEFAPLFGEEG